MSAPKHTPGPWHIHVRNSHRLHVDADEIIIAQQGNKPPVAFLHSVYLSCALKGKNEPRAWELAEQEVRANAALIAAAPDLLQALRDILAYSGIDPDADTRMGLREVNAARAAIAKAEGRQS